VRLRGVILGKGRHVANRRLKWSSLSFMRFLTRQLLGVRSRHSGNQVRPSFLRRNTHLSSINETPVAKATSNKAAFRGLKAPAPSATWISPYAGRGFCNNLESLLVTWAFIVPDPPFGV
jgi:hypothetical protein